MRLPHYWEGHLPGATVRGDEAPPEFLSFSLEAGYAVEPSLAEFVFSDRNVAMKLSSLLAERLEDDELVRIKDGRGLRPGFCCAWAADAKYDAGLNDRLAMLGWVRYLLPPSCNVQRLTAREPAQESEWSDDALSRRWQPRYGGLSRLLGCWVAVEESEVVPNLLGSRDVPQGLAIVWDVRDECEIVAFLSLFFSVFMKGSKWMRTPWWVVDMAWDGTIRVVGGFYISSCHKSTQCSARYGTVNWRLFRLRPRYRLRRGCLNEDN
jgi:hypothetical protein